MCIFTAALSESTLANACDLKVKQPNALGARYYCLVGGGERGVGVRLCALVCVCRSGEGGGGRRQTKQLAGVFFTLMRL